MRIMGMQCPNCRDKDLYRVLTKQGVEVDYCKECGGVWLDKGEIYYFTKTPTYLKHNFEESLKNQRISEKLSPKTKEPMVSITLFDTLIIEYCPKTGGLWLDKGELEKLPAIEKNPLNITLDKKIRIEEEKKEVDIEKERREKERLSAIGAKILPLPNLIIASGVTLTGLYALLVLILILCVQFLGLAPFYALIIGICVASFHFLLGPFLLDLSLRYLFRLSWIRPQDLPLHLKDFIGRVCKDKNMRFPRMGLINDGSPQAFTYGHHPNNARIVISKGLIDLLEKEELEAVVSHEIGHAKHWDMLVMTLAQLVPLILYYIYRTLIRMKSKGREDKTAGVRYLIAIGSYILYIISEYLVLWFSRIREYFADRFSGEVTQNPNNLASALVKIGYGLAGKEPDKKKEKRTLTTPILSLPQRRSQLESIGALGIFDNRAAKNLAIVGYSPQAIGGEINKDLLKEAMKWDLWNPWAMYYELHSTHPLIAKRLNRLSEQSVFLGKSPYITFDLRKPESYWDEFFVDLFIKFLPLLAIITGTFLFVIRMFLSFPTLTIINPLKFLGILGILFGAGYLINVLFSYQAGEFPEFSISGLLKKVKVSSVRPVPCTLRGKIIGRGIPGLIWSEDFVLRDETGIIFLDYRQPLGIWEFLFGLLRARQFINEDVVITGWYRRAPIPFIELKTLKDSQGKSMRCYVYVVKLVVAIILILLGIIFILR